MNLLLLDPGEIGPDGRAALRDRRARHARDVLGAAPGDRLAVGVVGGRIGTGEVLAGGDELVLRVTLERDAPPRSPVELLVALPRPKILRRVLQAAASMGIARLVLLGAWKVEKSYFQSPLLAADALAGQLRLGLEQGRDTLLPEVRIRRLFKPFVEDELDLLFPPPAYRRLLAHPSSRGPLAAAPGGPPRALVAVGPEGGWTDFEARVLAERGFVPFTFGERALRVDVAVPYAVGLVAQWLGAPGR